MKARILVVEDEPAIRGLLVDLLGEAGYAVSAAANGREALDRLVAEAPDLILLDLITPVISGRSVLRAVREDVQWSRIPVIVLSATNVETPAGLPVDATLDKPMDMDVLLSTIEGVLAKAARPEGTP